jgi:hypothetical protein
MFASQETLQSIATNAITKLKNLRDALEGVNDFNEWLVTQTEAQLTALGFSATDYSELTSALADANALYQFYDTGLPPSTYPQPASAYVYGASQRIVIGPQ